MLSASQTSDWKFCSRKTSMVSTGAMPRAKNIKTVKSLGYCSKMRAMVISAQSLHIILVVLFNMGKLHVFVCTNKTRRGLRLCFSDTKKRVANTSLSFIHLWEEGVIVRVTVWSLPHTSVLGRSRYRSWTSSLAPNYDKVALHITWLVITSACALHWFQFTLLCMHYASLHVVYMHIIIDIHDYHHQYLHSKAFWSWSKTSGQAELWDRGAIGGGKMSSDQLGWCHTHHQILFWRTH